MNKNDCFHVPCCSSGNEHLNKNLASAALAERDQAINFLGRERDAWRKLETEMAMKQNRLKERVDELRHALQVYGEHDCIDCVLAHWQGGEPTANGGYRVKYDGKWYQSRPIDETPQCTCGLGKALQSDEREG